MYGMSEASGFRSFIKTHTGGVAFAVVTGDDLEEEEESFVVKQDKLQWRIISYNMKLLMARKNYSIVASYFALFGSFLPTKILLTDNIFSIATLTLLLVNKEYIAGRLACDRND